MATTTVEQRLLALEREVAAIKSRLGASALHPPDADWISAISGSMKDEPEFDEVAKLGREIRRADASQQDGTSQQAAAGQVEWVPESSLVPNMFLLDTDHLTILQRQT